MWVSGSVEVVPSTYRSSTPWATIGPFNCLKTTPTASPPPPIKRLPDPSRSSSARPGSNVKRGSEWLKQGIRPRQPHEVAARPLFGLLWFKLKRASKGEGPIINSPTRPPWRTAVDAKGVCNCPRGGTRRCTNEAVRAMRPSEFDSRFRLAEAQCFPQHSGRTIVGDLGWGTPLNQPRPHAEPIPALVRFRPPALHGQALHGRMVRHEYELTSICRSHH